MKKFVRTPEYMTRLFEKGICDKDVHTDANIHIEWSKGKYRAWCIETQTWLQFPNKLRARNKAYIADVFRVPDPDSSREPFYRPIVGSIRDASTGNVVA